jgi:hypothetical protein
MWLRHVWLVIGLLITTGSGACGGSSEPAQAAEPTATRPVPCPAQLDMQSSFAHADTAVVQKRVLERHFDVHPKDCAHARVVRARVVRRGVEEADEIWSVERCDKLCFDYRVSMRTVGLRAAPSVAPVEAR